MAALSFPFNVYLAALLSAFATTFATLPFWRRWCVRHGVVDDPGHRKIHETPVPLAGGLAVLTGLLVPLLAAAVLLKLSLTPMASAAPLVHGLHRRALQLLADPFSKC